MSRSTSCRRLGLVFIQVWVLAACAAPQLAVEPIAPTENPSEHVNRFDAELTTARQQQLNVLAPTWFGRAESSLRDARQGLEGSAGVTEVLQKVAYGRAQLQRATEAAQVVRTTLPEVIQARDVARAANASSLGQDYAEAEAQFIALTRAAESDNLEWARRNQGIVSMMFRDLELRAIKTQTIGEVRQLLVKAEQQKMQRVAPATFAMAQQTLEDADAFISENPYEKATMRRKAQAALFQAQRLQHVAQQSKQLQTQKPEDVALWVEDMLTSITRQLRAPDMRNHPLETQVENIVKSIAALQEDRRFLQQQHQDHKAEVLSLKQQIADLEGQTREARVAKERLAVASQVVQARLDVERQFDQVTAQFTREEAQVYKQGNRLVIRLQAMQFPVGKEVIMPTNYPLLGKVQRAVRRFDGPEVTVEGHTDSTGSAAINQHLSQRRAEAVREYLIANGTLPGEKITAVGYGPERPLASNATAKGRAKNRRIDVIIAPQSPQTP